MFVLKVVIFHFFGWLMLLGSSGLSTIPSAPYTPIDSLVAADDKEHIPLVFDAFIDINHASTYETHNVKVFSDPHKLFQGIAAPLFYKCTYYAIDQQIVIILSIKTIIFPFHCFT